MSRVAVDAIDANPDQPRRHFDAKALEELRASIARHGVLCPLLVRPEGRRYVLIAGERRLRAAKAAGLRELPVWIRSAALGSGESLELALVENLQRADLDPIEAALGYRWLLDDHGYSQAQVAEAVGKDRSTIANAVRLLNLPEAVLERLRAGELSAGHGRALLPLAGGPHLDEAVEGVIADGLSVRATEALVRRLLAKDDDLDPRRQRWQAARPVAERLSARLDTQVDVRPRKDGSGRIVIDYDSEADLERLVKTFS